jgi:phosphopantetheinyl transferase
MSSSSSTSKKSDKKEEDDDGVHVYVLRRNQCEAPVLLQRYERLLSKKELESIQIDSLHEETRKERLQTRAMVRTVLSSYLVKKGMKSDPARLEFTFNEKGKPFLSNKVGSGNESSLIQFSVSHSKNIIAMAVTTDGRRVGIDCEVEKRRTKDTCLKLAKRYFKKGEAVERIKSALADDEDEGRKLFVRYWCLCESYVKALGVGISGRPFRNFDIALGKHKQEKKDAPHDDITLVESDPETFGRWRFQLFRETPPLKSESEEIKDERSVVAVCVEDDEEDDDDNKNRDKNNWKRPPIVSSIKRVRPLLDDVNANSAAANVDDDDDDDDEIFEIVAASF